MNTVFKPDITVNNTTDEMWQCAACGAWVKGMFHTCRYNYYGSYTYPPEKPAIERIADALERIAAALEKNT
jgi:hypothetical protein